MLMTFKALSVLLGYPSADLKPALPEIAAVLDREKILSPAARRSLDKLMAEIAESDLYDLQERYVLLFDRSRTLSLNLFEHVHSESRERGGAMVNLLETYRADGYDLAGYELPDHLPVFLEYLATKPLAEATNTLAEAGHILAALATRLERRESNYAAVLAALTELSGVDRETEAVGELLNEADDNPENLAALDAVWEEAEVTFGPSSAAECPASRDMLARMADPGLATARPDSQTATAE